MRTINVSNISLGDCQCHGGDGRARIIYHIEERDGMTFSVNELVDMESRIRSSHLTIRVSPSLASSGLVNFIKSIRKGISKKITICSTSVSHTDPKKDKYLKLSISLCDYAMITQAPYSIEHGCVCDQIQNFTKIVSLGEKAVRLYEYEPPFRRLVTLDLT